MKTYSGYVVLMAMAGSFQVLTAGEISGKVTLKGTPKPEITIDQMDATCGKMHSKPPTTRHYVTGADGALANVFVYIKEGAKPAPASAESPLLDQVNCMYEPYVLGAQVGQKIKIQNSDPVLHNIHATPKINKEFNFGQPIKGQVTEKAFDKPEVLVRMKCDVHPWMFAYIGVVDHPYFAVTGKDGKFTLSNVPPGKYTVEAYHLKTHGTAAGASQEITLGDGEKKTANFTVELPAQ